MHIVAIIGGAALIATMLGDAIGTLIVTRSRGGRWRPTRLWYLSTWRVASAVAARLPVRAADLLLNIYPALSLLGLLALWLAGQVVGWALVYWGAGGGVAGGADFGSLAYYAGASLVAAQFNTAGGASLHALSLVETVAGLGTVALLISYLPALYGAYSRREARLLTLDHPGGGRLVPAQLIQLTAHQGELAGYYRFCAEWEMWTAEVLESHVSYPMLALFRSQHPGQSWITALGVVVDSATLACACIPGADAREPYFLHRRGRRAVLDIARRLDVPERSTSIPWLTPESFSNGFAGLAKTGVPLYDEHEAFERLRPMYLTYGLRLQDLIDYLLAPHGFWGHSAEATVEQEVARAEETARERGSRRNTRARP